jgi:hypothetical protein
VVAGVDFECVLYRDISRYPAVLERSVVGNPEHLSAEELHASALPLVEPHLSAAARRQRDRLASAAHSSEVTSGLAGALPAADEGRVEVLFVAPERPVWGEYEDKTVRLHDERRLGDDDLLDLAISRSLEKGAEVIPAHEEDMPSDARVAALLRY